MLTEPGQALAGALELAQRICTNAPVSVQACLAAINELVRTADAAGWAATQEAVARISGTDDVTEGLRAFFEKRAPVWTGH